MYFITPSDPNIFLIGVYETKLYGIGEKNGKLCIYQRSMFDIGNWQEYFMINVKPVKCRSCKNGIHVASSVCCIYKRIWIAARESKFTRVFSINIGTKKFIRYKMLEEIYPEFALLDLNLCCKCLAPDIRYSASPSNFYSLIILPRQYKSEVGIYRIFLTVNQSNYCLLWKKSDSFDLHSHSSTNIFINNNSEVLSVIGKSEEDGRIETFSIQFDDIEESDDMHFDNDIWHEMSFCISDGFCLTQRKIDNQTFLQLFYINYSLSDLFLDFDLIDHSTVDINFPSLEETHFFVSYRFIDKNYISKKTNIIYLANSKLYVLVSFVVFQTADGKSIVLIPFRLLSLSESAYLSLARIPNPSSLPIANISFFNYLFQSIRNLFHQKEVHKDDWMSVNFIKKSIGWPKILPLTKEPNFLK